MEPERLKQTFSETDVSKLRQLCVLLSSNDDVMDEMLNVYLTASAKLAVYQDVKSCSSGVSYGFSKVVPRFLHLLRECLVMHKWPQALQIVQALVGERDKAGSTIWKVGLAGLYQDGERNTTLIDKFVKNLCTLKQVSSLEVLLDYLLFLLVQGNVGEAKELVMDWKAEKRERSTMYSNEKRKMASTLFFAYQGLILYTEWKVATSNAQDEEDEDMFELTMSQNVMSRNIRFLADGAIEYLATIQDTPGVWDIFVTRLAEIYEYYEMEECRTLLSGYRAKNMNNPNAHRYLYEFEERKNGDREVILECLKSLITLDPSNSLALTLYKKLVPENEEEALSVLFDYLDFPQVEENEKAWKLLAKALPKIEHKIVLQQWDLRKDWWPQTKFPDDSKMSKYKTKVKTFLEKLESSGDIG